MRERSMAASPGNDPCCPCVQSVRAESPLSPPAEALHAKAVPQSATSLVADAACVGLRTLAAFATGRASLPKDSFGLCDTFATPGRHGNYEEILRLGG